MKITSAFVIPQRYFFLNAYKCKNVICVAEPVDTGQITHPIRPGNTSVFASVSPACCGTVRGADSVFMRSYSEMVTGAMCNA